MGLLLNYFESLKYGDIIDRDIFQTMRREDIGNSNVMQTIYDSCTQKGLYIPKYFSWYIPYVEKKINFHLVVEGQDAISTDFSGCAMACFYNHKSTQKYVAHICLLGNSIDGDCRDVWRFFCNKNPSNYNTRLFIPKTMRCVCPSYNAVSLGRLDPWGNTSIYKWGLISHMGRCYEIIVEYKDNNLIFHKISETKSSINGHLPKSEWDYYNINWISRLSDARVLIV